MFSSLLSRQRGLSYIHGTSDQPLISEHISQRLRSTTQKYPDNIAIISQHQNIKWTYEEFNQKVDTVAKGLVALGLKRGDRIGIYA